MDLPNRELALKRQLEQARQEYDNAARDAASGDATPDLPTIRARIASLEGELADVRATIAQRKGIESEAASAAARAQRVRLLKDAVTAINNRVELAPKLVEQIAALGETYRVFVQLGQEARTNAAKADRSKHLVETVDQALGVQQGVDQMLAGLFHYAGLGNVMKESGALWAKTAEGQMSFVDINFQRCSRAMTAVRYQIDQENANAETPLSSRRAS